MSALRNNNRRFTKHEPGICIQSKMECPNCTSSDAFHVYQIPNTKPARHYGWCYSCQTRENNPPGFLGSQRISNGPNEDNPFSKPFLNNKVDSLMSASPTPKTSTESIEDVLSDFLTYPTRAIPDRKITKETCEHYGVRVSLDERDGETIISHKYPYYKGRNLSGYKERVVEGKVIFSKGDVGKVGLFGSHVARPNAKTLFITEGELDCLALYQTLRSLSTLPDYQPSVVSLTHGAASAVKDISYDLEFVDSFEKIVLVFDQDDPGQAAQDEVCKLLAGKVFTATLSEKDPCDMVMAGKESDLYWAVLKHARHYMPDSIVSYADGWDRYKNSRNQTSFPFPKAWKELNDKTYGARMGELIMVTSGSGMGKTQFLRELKYHYYQTTDFKMADIALEEDVGDSIGGLMSVHLNKRITLPDVHVPEEEEREAFEYLFGSDRWTGYDHFGGLDDDNLFSKIRFFAATGHKILFLDHLSIIVSEFASEGGERERIDTIMTKLAKLVKELNITIFLVVHLKKTSSQTSFEEGATPSLDDLRGSGSLKQLSMTVIALSRNQQHFDKYCANTSKITVLKCRFTGRTGTADFLHFEDNTGRMVAVPKPARYDETSEKPQRTFGGQF